MIRSRRVGRLRIAAVGIAAAATSAALAVPPSTAATNAPKVASGAPLVEALVTAFTGPESFIGGVLSAGTYPAVYEINKAGGVLGHKFVVKTVDTRGDPADALPLVERFLGSNSNVVGAVGPDGATANQLIPLFNAHKISIISDAGSSYFDRSPYKYFWRLTSPDPINGLAMAEWAHKLGYTRVALVFGTDTTAQTDLPGIQYGISHLHLNVVANIALTPDQPTYQTDAAQLLAAKPQAIFTEEDATTAGTFFGDVAQLGSVPKIIGDSGTIENSWMSAVSSAVGSSNFASIYTGLTSQSAKTSPANAAWQNALNHSLSNIPKPANQWYNETYAQAAHDGVIIQALAMVASHSVRPAIYNAYMGTVSRPGAGKTKVYTFAQGKAALNAGKKIQYIGATGPSNFDKYGNSYGNQVAVSFPTGNITNEKVLGVIQGSILAAAG